MDPSARWWPDTELQRYVSEWQDVLQYELEFVWNRGTLTTSTNTLTLSGAIQDFMRLDAVYRNGQRLSPRTVGDMDQYNPDWRRVVAGQNPVVAFQEDHETVSFWPPGTSTYTYTLEYPREVSFASTTNTMELPAWVRYSAVDYVCYRAFLRYGPNYDLQKAMRRKSRWLRRLAALKNFYGQRFPIMPLQLRPGGQYEVQIVEPAPVISEINVPGPITTTTNTGVTPGGTINGTNTAFTLPSTPNPTSSLMLFKDGVLQRSGVHYSLSGTNITFIDPYQPVSGQDLWANYDYAA